MLYVEVCQNRANAEARKSALKEELKEENVKGTRILSANTDEAQDIVVAHIVSDGAANPDNSQVVFNGNQNGVKEPAAVLLLWT